MEDDSPRLLRARCIPAPSLDVVVQIGQALQSYFLITLVRYLNHEDELRSLISLQHAISHWCLVSRSWYFALNPILYRKVVIYQYKQASQLVRVLPRFGYHTNTVVLDCINSMNIWKYTGALVPLQRLSNLFLLHLNLLLVHPSFSVTIRTLRRLSYNCRIHILEVSDASELQLRKMMLVLPRPEEALQETFSVAIRPQTKSPCSTPLLEALRCDTSADREWAILGHHVAALKNEDYRQPTEIPRARTSLPHSLGHATGHLSKDLNIVFLDLLSKDFSAYSGGTRDTLSLPHNEPNHSKTLSNFETLFRFTWAYHLFLPLTSLDSNPSEEIRAQSMDCFYSFLDTHGGLSREYPMYHFRRYILDRLSHLCWNMAAIPSAMNIDVKMDSAYRGSRASTGLWRGRPIVIRSPCDVGYYLYGNCQTVSLKLLFREVVRWRQLRHDNILTVIGFSPTEGPFPSLIYPFLRNGNIRGVLYTSRIDTKQLDIWLLHIAKGLEYLHSERIVHGTLHGRNILIADDFSAKLFNFHWDPSLMHPPYWTAPELRFGEIDEPCPSTDVYSFGCAAIEIYTRKTLIPDIESTSEIISFAFEGAPPARPSATSWKTMDDQLWHLVERCLDEKPDQRPTVQEVILELSKLQARGD